jgi:WD40 repeat protein/serine/threonine protein kinase
MLRPPPTNFSIFPWPPSDRKLALFLRQDRGDEIVDRAKAELDSIFCDALELTSLAERAAYLDRICGDDPDLRRRVERLLEAHVEAEGFLAVRPSVAAVTSEVRAEAAGTIIGPYKLLEQIGEGGFGVVFMAEQQQPIRRKVALKVIKPGMDTKQVVARFEAERQALALMDSPNIAKVLDAGTTDGGRPYFVMDLVRGVPITQFCDDNRLTPRERLELFVAVCQAVQHAHQKGIIHRDLKPNNVLVTLNDGKPMVKVIDFGIAKALGQERLTDKTLCTGFAQMIGTPLYMSPEQAEMSAQDADTRTDIYALGVLLYELLTGTTPFDKERLKDASYDEIRRIIREEEPAKPSTRISTLGQTAATVSANRQSEPRRLSQLFRGELDWIVMKALEKDTNRRYETASSFAADVQRYLHDEPVHACRPSAPYRFRKFARRHQAALMTASAIAFAVLLGVAGLAASTVFVWRANQELRQNLYYQHIALAEREWSANNLGRVEQLLDACPVELRGWEWHYLKRLRLGDPFPLDHGAAVLSATFSPDGRWIASGGLDGWLKIWDANTREPLSPFKAHERQIRCVAFSPDGRRLATASWDRTAKIWDFDPQRAGAAISLLHAFEHQAEVQHVAFSPDGEQLATAGNDQTVRIWDVATGHEVLHPLRGHTSIVWCVAYSPDGHWLASASGDKTVHIWDAKTGQEMHPLRGHRLPVLSVCFSHDSRWLASASGDMSTKVDGEINVWDARTGQPIRTLRGHTGCIFQAVFSSDAQRLASAGMDETVKLWDLQTGQEALTLRGHRGYVRSVAFSPDGTRLISASHDGTVRIWDATPLEGGIEQEALTLKHPAGVRSVVFSPNGRQLASAADDAIVRIWDYRRGLAGSANPLLKTLLDGTGLKSNLAYSSNGQLLASGAGGGHQGSEMRIWDVNTWEELSGFTLGSPLAFSRDGRYLAGVSQHFTIEIREATNGRRIHPLAGHEWNIFDLAFDPNPEDPRLFSASADRTIRIWDVRTGLQVGEALRGHTSGVRCLALSRDGRYLATGSMDRSVKIWDAKTGQLLQDLPDPTGGVQSVAFHPNNARMLAWAGNDSTVKIVTNWEAAIKKIRTLHGHTKWVESVAFSPDGEWIASASLDGTVKVWRTPPLLK